MIQDEPVPIGREINPQTLERYVRDGQTLGAAPLVGEAPVLSEGEQEPA